MLDVKRRPTKQKWPDDPRDIPMYTIAEVASSLRMHPSTLADWTTPRVSLGQRNETFAPLIDAPESELAGGRLSFYNVIEAHMLLATLRHHMVPILTVRRALDWVKRTMPVPHPLVEYKFQTKGKHIFVSKLMAHTEGQPKGTVDASLAGQHIISEILDRYLMRIHRDQSGVANRLFPIAPGTHGETEPVMMDINFASGKLVVTETGVLAAVLHGRYKAGHSIEKLVRDYRLSPEQIRGAIDYLETAA